jgi:hypothetical protein
MKGSRAMLAIAAIVLVLGAATLWAQSEYTKPLDKVINPVRASVKFDAYVFTFQVDEALSVRFEKIDRAHVRLTMEALNGPRPAMEVMVQWGNFPPLGLTLDSSGDNAFILNTETGYAEK